MTAGERQRLSVIGFDADDTLWHNERQYRLTEERFGALLSQFVDAKTLSDRLLATEKRNLAFYGYGVKGFVLSMIETAIEVTKGEVSTEVISQILAFGHHLLSHPVDPLPGAFEVLKQLSERAPLVLITKGDLFDQERKLAQSGLGDVFCAVDIVSEKSAETYREIFGRFDGGPRRALMVGNSLRSDCLPALAAGSFAIHIPYEVTWAMELDQRPAGRERFFEVKSLAEVPDLVPVIEVAIDAAIDASGEGD